MSYQIEVNSKDSILLHIDSRDATKYLQSDITSYFQYILKDKVDCPSNQILLVSLHSASIPYSFYNIRSGINNHIDLKIADFTSGSAVGEHSTSIELTSSNHSAFTLADLLKTKLDSAFSSHYHYSTLVDYDNDTNKLTFSITPNNTDSAKVLRITMLFSTGNNAHKTINEELGFNVADVFFDKNTSLTSTNSIDINGSIHGIFVRTNLTSKSVLDSQNGNLSNILGRIPIDVQPGGIIFHRPRDCIHHSLVKSKDVSNLTIKLTDERNRILDLNGLHFQVGIKIDYLYDKKQVIEPTTAELRIKNLTKDQVSQRQLEELLNQESEKARLELEQKLQKGQVEIEEEGETIRLKKKKVPVGRPRKVGRPTRKELKRRNKFKELKRQAKLQEKLTKASEDFYTEEII